MATLVAALVGHFATPTTASVEDRALVSPYFLTGLPLSLARQLAAEDGLHLSIIRVPAIQLVGQVIGQDLNFQKDRTVVVSTGKLHDPFKVLPPATVPPRRAECAGGLVLYEDGNVGPLTCHGGVNVGAWENFARGGSTLMGLGRSPTESQVIAAICAGNSHTTLNQLDSAYQLASTYYGWPFGEQLFIDYGYGLNGKRCSTGK